MADSLKLFKIEFSDEYDDLSKFLLQLHIAQLVRTPIICYGFIKEYEQINFTEKEKSWLEFLIERTNEKGMIYGTWDKHRDVTLEEIRANKKEEYAVEKFPENEENEVAAADIEDKEFQTHYPTVQWENTKLVGEEAVQEDGVERVILTFEGDKAYFFGALNGLEDERFKKTKEGNTFKYRYRKYTKLHKSEWTNLFDQDKTYKYAIKG